MKTPAAGNLAWLLLIVSLPACGADSSNPGPPLSRDARYWVAPERTPGRLVCRRSAADDVWITCDRWPDGSDLRRFGQDAIRLCDAKTDHEKCLAVYRWIRRWMIYPNQNGAPTEKIAGLHHKRGFVDQGLKQLNVYGAHWCDGQVRIMEAVWRALGYRAEKVVRGGHTIAACGYEDFDAVFRWHALDVSHSGLLFDRSHRRLLSLDELSTAYYNGYYQWIFCPHNDWDDHRMEWSLRAGEKLERIWGNWGKPYQDNIARGDTKVPRCERGPYPLDYGNGRWTYTPDLGKADWIESLAETPRNMAAGELRPDTAQPATAVWDFRTPYIISDARVTLRAEKAGPEDQIRLHLSVDEGQTWNLLWECPTQVTVEREWTIPICDRFQVTGSASPPVGFHSPFGRYAYRLKLELRAKEAARACRVKGISFETVVQLNSFSLPQLQPGRNRISVVGKLAEGSALRVTYLWKDLLDDHRKNVTEVEKTPYTFEILAAGRKWEDCVCESLLVEAIRATGNGNRTLVREEPSQAAGTAPMKPVEQTAVNWYQPDSKDLRDADSFRKNLHRGTDLKRSLGVATMLADSRDFESVARIVYQTTNPEAKNQALVALYVIDPARARPILFEVANSKDASKWDTRKDPTGEAPWIASTAVIGYLAAEAGWREFLPLLTRALANPTAWPGWGPRYGLLRVIGRLGHGDAKAAAAIRDVLAGRSANDEDDGKSVASLAAGQIGDPSLIPELRRCLLSEYEPLKQGAALSLSLLGDVQLAPTARQWLAVADDENYRAVGAEALGNLRHRESMALLSTAQQAEPFPWVRLKIADAIQMIQAR